MKFTLSLLILFTLSLAVSAQVLTTKVSGIVSDRGGDMVSGVRIIVENQSTSQRYVTVSNSAGGFRIFGVTQGNRYNITVEQRGKEPFSLSDFAIYGDDEVVITVDLSTKFVAVSSHVNVKSEFAITSDNRVKSLLDYNSRFRASPINGDFMFSGGADGYNRLSIGGVDVSNMMLREYASAYLTTTGMDIKCRSDEGVISLTPKSASNIVHGEVGGSYLLMPNSGNFGNGTMELRTPIISNRLFLALAADYNTSNFLKEYKMPLGVSNKLLSDSGYTTIWSDAVPFKQSYYNISGRIDYLLSLSSHLVVTGMLNAMKGDELPFAKPYYLPTPDYGVRRNSSVSTIMAELNSNIIPALSNRFAVHGAWISRSNGAYNSNELPAVVFSDEQLYFGQANTAVGDNYKELKVGVSERVKWNKGAHSVGLELGADYHKISGFDERLRGGEYRFTTLSDLSQNTSAKTYNYHKGADGKVTDFSVKELLFQLSVEDNMLIRKNLSLTVGVRVNMVSNVASSSSIKPDDKELWRAIVAEQGWEQLIKGSVSDWSDINLRVLALPYLHFRWSLLNSVLDGRVALLDGNMPYNVAVQSQVWNGGRKINNIFENHKFDPSSDVDYEGLYKNRYYRQFLFSQNLKTPTRLNLSLHLKRDLRGVLSYSLYGVFNRYFNDVTYTEMTIGYKPLSALTSAGDSRSIYSVYSGEYDRKYESIEYLSNGSAGYGYNVGFEVSKSWRGFATIVSYDYSDAYRLPYRGGNSLNPLSYNINSQGINRHKLSRVGFGVGHKLAARVAYLSSYSQRSSTYIMLRYRGESGYRYSYTIDGAPLIKGYGGDMQSTIYIPRSSSDIELVDGARSDGTLYSKEEQWDDLNRFIESDKYLSSRRGKVSQRNAGTTAWSHSFDISVAQNLIFNRTSGRQNNLQLSVAMFNIGNIINQNWGHTPAPYFNGEREGSRPLLLLASSKDDNTPIYKVNERAIKSQNSDCQCNTYDGFRHWQMKIQLKYSF